MVLGFWTRFGETGGGIERYILTFPILALGTLRSQLDRMRETMDE